MKPYPKFRKLPLIALLSLGLVCSPLVVNADDSNRDWYGHTQQNHGKSHHRADHRRVYRDYGHHKNHGYRHSYRKGDKHGYKSGHHYYRPKGHQGHYVDIQRHYWGGHHYDGPGFFLSLQSDTQDALFCD